MMPEDFMGQMIQPMREELTRAGFTELVEPDQVDAELGTGQGTTLVVVNSICGCAGGIARPGVAMALQNEGPRPDRLVTVFAGQDREATARAREYFTGFAPSSPSIALMREGRVVHMVERHQIEGRDAHQIAADLSAAFDKHCAS